jgi:nucleotide-binding universal stress UspA family protein
MGHIRKILVPSDGSPPSIAALHEATMLAGELDASVEVLHVTPETDAMTPVQSEEDHYARDLDRAYAEAERALGPRIARRSERGDPVQTIVHGASGFDLIVMGTHGRVGRLHALLGSVTEAVVRNAPCPVLTVREPSGVESFAERRHGRSSIAEQTG